MKSILHFAILFMLNSSLNHLSGQSYNLPKGYEAFKDYDGKEQRADGDFDGDGVTDIAIVCSTKNSANIVAVYLASKYLIDRTYYWFPWESEMNTLEFKDNILSVTTNEDAGRFHRTLNFQYKEGIREMQLIEYMEENFGGYQQDGYYKNINLLTGEYEIAGVKRKLVFDVITLANIEKYFDYLGSVGNNYIKSSIQSSETKNDIDDWTGVYTDEFNRTLKLTGPASDGALQFELSDKNSTGCSEGIKTGTAYLMRSYVANYDETGNECHLNFSFGGDITVTEYDCPHGGSCRSFSGTYKKK